MAGRLCLIKWVLSSLPLFYLLLLYKLPGGGRGDGEAAEGFLVGLGVGR